MTLVPRALLPAGVLEEERPLAPLDVTCVTDMPQRSRASAASRGGVRLRMTLVTNSGQTFSAGKNPNVSAARGSSPSAVSGSRGKPPAGEHPPVGDEMSTYERLLGDAIADDTMFVRAPGRARSGPSESRHRWLGIPRWLDGPKLARGGVVIQFEIR